MVFSGNIKMLILFVQKTSLTHKKRERLGKKK